MPSIPLLRVAEPVYPFSQLFKDLADALPSCLCKEDSDAFQVVHLYKNNFNVGPVEIHKNHPSFIKDVATGHIYRDESENIIRGKSILLLLAVPLWTACVIIWDASQLILNIQLLVLRILESLYTGVTFQEIWEDEIYQLPFILYERLKGIATAPFYGVAMEVAALFAALIKPYHGRKLVAMIEHAWQGGAPYTEMEKLKAVYLAGCFQVRATITVAEEGDYLESPASLLKFPNTPTKTVKIDWVRQSSTSNDSAVVSERTSS